MRKNFGRIIAVFLSLMMLVGSFATMSVSASTADEAESVKKGEFIFAPHTYPDGDLTDIYYYTDTVFSGSAFDYNEHLATMSMILASASISSQDADAGYDIKSRNLSYLFREWDFTGFEVNEFYTQQPGEQTMGVGMAYKVVGEGENAYTVLAIIPRSAGYQKEWAGNFTVGTEGVHQGFATGRDIILEFAKNYVAENMHQFEGVVKIWTVGYSRGAGVSNLLAAHLDDHSNALGVEVKKENIFAYTFGTPSTVEYADEAEKALLESNYLNIHNRYSEYDIVTYAPFKDWNFTYYGTTKLFDVHNAEKKAQMLTFLEKTNQLIYDLYTEEGSTTDPDNFAALMLQVGMTEDGLTVGIVPADSAYGIADNQADFLNSRISFLVNHLVPDRETYVEGGYQYALQRLTSLYFGLDAQQSTLLFEGMSHDIKTLAAVYYCYFIADYYLSQESSVAFTASILIDSLPMIEAYLTEEDFSNEDEMPEWLAFAYAFMQTEEYRQIKALLPLVVSDVDGADEYIVKIQDTVRNFAVGMTAKVLGSGIAALTIEESEKAELMATMTSQEVAAPLTDFFVYLLLGSDDGVVAPFHPGNKNIALAITFLSNAGRYMRVHNNEIILSWLRTEDSYYANEDWHIHKTEIKFDENGHWSECECGYKDQICAHAFGDWGTIPVKDGEEDVVVRRCPCGYEETMDALVKDPSTGKMDKPLNNTTIILIVVGVTMIIAGVVVMIVITKKNKSSRQK